MSGGHGGGGGKVWTILVWTFVLFIIGLVLFWLVTGGPQRAWQAAKNFTNPIAVIFQGGEVTGSFLRLPWQPEDVRGPDIADYVGIADQQLQEAYAQQSPQQSADVSRLQQYGNPSPYQGAVSIVDRNPHSNPAREYIEITASSDNAAPIGVSGWTIQSAVSGRSGLLPLATERFSGGSVNSVQVVTLEPGTSAILTTGISPIGVSFRENRCSGYLAQTQTFYPALSGSCPAPSEALPMTAQNLQTYGSACFDYVDNIQACTLAGGTLPANLSQACKEYLRATLTYNGCVALYGSRANFALPSWRLYLNGGAGLWNPSHDVVRLLDNQGRVVDVLQY